MMRKLYTILICLVTALTVVGCSSAKKAIGSGSSYQKSNNEIITKVADSYSNWSTFSTSGRISIDMGNGQSFSSSMQLKMENNKYIFISLRPILGIEAARIYITNDSLILIDKYHKAYLAEDIRSFGGTMPTNLATVQDIFLNRIFSLSGGTLSQKNEKDFDAIPEGAGAYRIKPKSQLASFSYSFLLNSLNQMTQIEIVPQGTTTHYTVGYSDFIKSFNAQQATEISMQTLISNKTVNIGLEYNSSRIKWNATLDDQITINEGYRRITLNELVSLLKQI